ncbi:alcohol dehydrogenase yqhd [Anaeramoeba flamelloides]|uniref:Alcohol dehydrogenase yqhd n=1 Tax=Anaeramoeba flamelloides TaxID=1746091 RepID=A0AAV7ZQE5_9EUKA|nr:alcohol dehydrogenase yqhd [Anaeramoeba flamelloides]|eukprot:Anaeramoba_flamelloidesa809952_1053.p1 GENE.a809952_1053~~a809952_1053.p1  ORF type:complete len:401 (-),score=113.33 a809952_1053:170-1372(-)
MSGMSNFIHYNPTKIIFGKETIQKNLKDEVPKGSKVMMIYGGGSIKKNGTYDKVMTALDGYEVTEFGGVKPNPSYELAMKAVKVIKDKGIDFLLAVGGGSVLDSTKFIALAAVYEAGDPWNMTKMNKSEEEEPTKVVPFGAILTLPATGSEANMWTVVNKNETNEKRFVGSPLIFPKFSILDPETTYSLPWRQTRNGIVDTFIHIIEYYVNDDDNTSVPDRFAESLITILMESAVALKKNPNDYVARANFFWASTQGNNGSLGYGIKRQDWGLHWIAHEITAISNADHALTLACVVKGYWTHQKERKASKLKMMAEKVYGVTEGTDEEKVQACIDKTVEWLHSVDMPTNMSECNITKEDYIKIGKKIDDFYIKECGMKGIGSYGDITGKETIEILNFCDF